MKSYTELDFVQKFFINIFIGIVVLISILLIAKPDKKVKVKDVSYYQYKIDSLQNELFIEQTNTQRYETAIDMMQSEDSELYEKFEKYLSQTE